MPLDPVDISMLSSTRVSREDVLNSVIFAGLLPIAWFTPQSAWWPITRVLAGVHIGLRGSHSAVLAGADLEARIGLAPKRLERDFMAGVYMELLQTLRAHRPGRWTPSIRLIGCDILEPCLRSRAS